MNGLAGGRFRFRTVGVVCVKAKSSEFQLASVAPKDLKKNPFVVDTDVKEATFGRKMNTSSSIHRRS